MTDLMEKAIDRVRGLPRDRQDEIALAILEMSSEPIKLSAAENAAVKEGRAAAKVGDFASEEEVATQFERLRTA